MNKDKILVIDDDQRIFDSIEDTLGDDYQLYHAENGETGLRLLAELSPILILLDIRMPVMDGFEFLKRIGISFDDPYSVIVLSGHTVGSEIGACYQMGITAFLRKPFNIFELKGLVKQCISAKKQYQALLHEKQYIRALFDYSMDMIIALDHACNMVEVNPTAAKLLGYMTFELQGVPFQDFFAEQAQFEAVKAFLSTGSTFSEQIALRHREGALMPVTLKFAVLHDALGQPIEMVVGEENHWTRASILLTQQTEEIYDDVLDELTIN